MVPLAVKTGAVVTPLPSVATVTVLLLPWNVPPALLAGAVKVTLMPQLAPTPNVAGLTGQVLPVIAKSPALVPVTVKLVNVTTAFPVFWTDAP